MDLSMIGGLGLGRDTATGMGSEAQSGGSKGSVPKIIQPSFAAGELSNSLAGRVDMAKYRVGLARCENFMVLPGGGVTNRPGLQFVAPLSGAARLIPFRFSVTQGYMLVFLDKQMLIVKDGGLVEYPNTPIRTPGSPFSAGGDYAGDIPDNAFDNDLGTWWRSIKTGAAANGVAAIGSDLGSSTTVVSVRLQQGTGVLGNVINAETQITHTILQSSADGVTWADVQNMDWTPTDLNTLHDQTISVTIPSSAEYWRLLQIDTVAVPSDGYGGWAVRELSFMSVQGGIVSVVSPFAGADLPDVNFVQSADTIFFAHPNYPPYKLIRYSHYDWEFFPLSFVSDISIPHGVTAIYNGGNPKGFSTKNPSSQVEYSVSSIDANDQESLPSTPISVDVDSFWYSGAKVRISWNSVEGAVSYKVYKDTRGFLGLIGNVTGSSQTAVLVPSSVISSSDGPLTPAAYAFDGNVQTYWTSGERGQTAVDDVSYIGMDYGSSVKVAQIRLRQGAKKNSHSICSQINIQYSGDGVAWTTLVTWVVPKVVGIWQDYYINNPTISARYWRLQAHLSAAASAGLITVIDPITGDVSSSVIAGADSARWAVAEVEFHGTGNNTTFDDDNINEDAGQGPLTDQNPFADVDSDGNNYPAVVGIFQQRLWFARTNNNPQTLWASRTGLFESMSTSYPIQSDDALEFTLDSKEVNEIRYLVPMRSLLIFTSGGEWAMSGANGLDAVTPTSVSNKVQGYRGCATGLPPIPVGRNVLFVQRNGAVVREMEYNLYVDLYTADNVSVLADHMFLRHTLIQWAYAQDPFSIIWAVRDDGVLLGFTYMKEQDVWAWHRHLTDGWFRSVCSVDEGNGYDEVYFVIERGTGNFTLEKFYPRNIVPQPSENVAG